MKIIYKYDSIIKESFYIIKSDTLELYYDSKGDEISGTINGKDLRTHNVVGWLCSKRLSMIELKELSKAVSLFKENYRKLEVIK